MDTFSAEFFVSVIGFTIFLGLSVFTLRRVIFTASVILLRRPRKGMQKRSSPSRLSVLVCLPTRNEANTISPLLSALAKLEYSHCDLTVALLNDASTDETQSVFNEFTKEKHNWLSLQGTQPIGKAALLNKALGILSAHDIYLVYDADQPPPGLMR